MRLLLGSCFLLALCSAVIAAADTNPIKNFHEVTPDVYRGAAPGKAGIDYLVENYHLKTDIDLEKSRFISIDEEKKYVDEFQIDFEKFPMSAPRWLPASMAKVDDKTAQGVLDLMLNPNKYPVFVHCLKGDDRTGMIVGIYRVKSGQLSPDAAYAEMLENGFHTAFHGLMKYFRDQTGYTGPEKLSGSSTAKN